MRFRFSCRACGAEFAVDHVVRAQLLATGCIRCQSPIDLEDFTELAASRRVT